MATLYIKPEREKVVDFVPYLYSGTAIAVSKEHPAAITGMDDSLCGKKVMVAVATTAEALSQEQSEKCTAAGKQPVDINRNSQAAVAIQQVQNGQMDAYLDTAETIGYYITKTGAQIQFAGEPFGTIKVGAATLKGNTELHNAIEQAFGELVSDGTYNSVLEQWGQTDLSIQKGPGQG
jgi:polar amino acid transport system substrate-binding protein